MTANRFFIEKKKIKGKKAILDGREHHHLSNVVRVKKNDRIWLFDEEGNTYLGRVEEIKKKESIISILETKKKPSEGIKIVLVVALIKPSLMELIIQKATELGVDEIIPLITLRSRSLPEEKILNQRLIRWRRIALEALKQSKGVFIPKIYQPIKLSELTRIEGEKKLFLSERQGKLLRERIINVNDIPNSVILVVGPEGGWDKKEEDELISIGFQPVSLGERILRSETAAISSLSIVTHFWKY